MFRKAVALSTALILASGASVYLLLVPVRPADAFAYQKLLEESSAIHSRPSFQSHPIEQARFGVQKDFWTLERDKPLHVCIKSQNSHLSIGQKKSGVMVKEKAESFEAVITEEDGVYRIGADRAQYQEERLELFGHVEIEYPGGKIGADHAVWDQRELSIDSHVKIRDEFFLKRPSFVVADQLKMNRDNQMVVLRGEAPRRVLFWQEGLSMSAPELRIHRKSGTVEGIGDLHFLFDLEEKNILEKIFGKPL